MPPPKEPTPTRTPTPTDTSLQRQRALLESNPDLVRQPDGSYISRTSGRVYALGYGANGSYGVVPQPTQAPQPTQTRVPTRTPVPTKTPTPEPTARPPVALPNGEVQTFEPVRKTYSKDDVAGIWAKQLFGEDRPDKLSDEQKA